MIECKYQILKIGYGWIIFKNQKSIILNLKSLMIECKHHILKIGYGWIIFKNQKSIILSIIQNIV